MITGSKCELIPAFFGKSPKVRSIRQQGLPIALKVFSLTEDIPKCLINCGTLVQAGDTLCKIEGITKGVAKRYTSVQSGINEHFELNSDLVYMNHSCSPSVHVNVDKMEIKALKNIVPGEEVTFFYCSTEYEMDQPFQCWCGAPEVRFAASTGCLTESCTEGHF